MNLFSMITRALYAAVQLCIAGFLLYCSGIKNVEVVLKLNNLLQYGLEYDPGIQSIKAAVLLIDEVVTIPCSYILPLFSLSNDPKQLPQVNQRETR